MRRDPARQGARFGRSDAGAGERVGVEFVSANPTGPLHVGHGRQAALGDCDLRALLDAQGWTVTREFYYNDAGVQIDNLASSVQARAQGIKPGDAELAGGRPTAATTSPTSPPTSCAAKTVESRRPPVTASGRRRRPRRDPPVRRRLPAPRAGRRPAGVRRASSTTTSSSRRCTPTARSSETVQRAGRRRQDLRGRRRAVAAHHRLRRRQGPRDAQVRRHLHLLRAGRRLPPRASGSAASTRRSPCRAADHHGTHRARARRPAGARHWASRRAIPDYVLHKMVTVMRGGEEVKISKRAGSYVTLRDLIEWSRRATRCASS